MASKEEFQAYMKTAANQIEGSGRPCPGATELMAYHQGQGDDNAREAMASHLSVCGACREQLFDVRHFFDPARDDSAGAVDLDREWSRFSKARATPIRPVQRSAPAWFSGPVLAWAAVLAVVTLTTLLWTLWTQRRFRAEAVAAQNRILHLQEENRSLRAARENDLAALTTPRLDAASFDLYSRASRERSGGSPSANRVRLAAGAPAVFFLNGEGQPVFPDYAVEILDRQSRPVWHGEGLKRSAQGSYLISFPPGFLREGEYRMEVFGIQNGAKTKVAEYDLSITVAR